MGLSVSVMVAARVGDLNPGDGVAEDIEAAFGLIVVSVPPKLSP